jgi:DNA-binding LytR/AlgR family response regulator
MLKYRCLVVEDEPLAAEILVDYISQVPFLELRSVCSDAFYAMEILQMEKIDLIFLDIHLPKLKGMEFLESLKASPSVIITSAYKDYALQAFDVGVIDYLLKPIRFSRFLKAVGKMYQPNRAYPAEPAATAATERKYVYFNVGKKRVKIYIDEILFIESLREYVRITTAERSIQVKYHITEMEEMLSRDSFVRVHRSFIVSKSKVTAFTASEVEIGGKQIPIGRSYKELVITLLGGGEE